MRILVLVAALIAAPVLQPYDAPAAAPALAAVPAPAPVLIVGRVAVNGSLALPGVPVQLEGAVQRTAVTDANGAFVFRVPPGMYALRAPPFGEAVFTPAFVDLDLVESDTVQDFRCAVRCGEGPPVVAAKELVITDPTVTESARASNAVAGAPWSFRTLMEELAPPGSDAADFVAAWLAEMEAGAPVNGFPVEARRTAALRALWPTTAAGKLDLGRAPFRLLAVTNRVDLHAAGNGEARLVFGVVDAAGAGRPMTVAFEYELPAADPATGAPVGRKQWAMAFHALGALPFGPQHAAALQVITDRITRRGAAPARPGGSALAQLRTNEVLMGGPWQLREFRLVAAAPAAGAALALRLVPAAQTPADAVMAVGTAPRRALLRHINVTKAAIHAGIAPVPGGLLGGQASESFGWSFSEPVDEKARHDFATQTCNGCHFSETGGLQLEGFYHVSPTADPGPDGSGRLSRFVKLFEIGRRVTFLQNALTCVGAECAAGAEPMM